jgi:hypothetical protein
MIRALSVVALVSFVAVGCSTAPTTIVSAPQRQQFLELFARAYYPGRSGQIFVVPREGDIIVFHDELYRFMHGSPWPYDSRIPLFFSGAPFIKQGRPSATASQQDVAPTLAAVLGIAPPATVTGHVLRDALADSSARPRVIGLFVLDGMRADYFDRYADAMPTLTRLKDEGAWYSEARINYLPTVTSVGHATVGTGTDPRIHGQSSNTIFNKVTGKPQQAYDNLDPRELMALTLADQWNIVTEGRAIIVAQGGAMRATAGLVGHGACVVGGRPVIAASYSTVDAGWETNPDCYRMPDYLKQITGTRYWVEAGGRWMDHDIASPSRFRASSIFQRFEGDALLSVIEHEALGADDVTDLVLVNMKGPDYTGHAYGPDSPEIRETLAELDRQMTKVVAALEKKAGPRQTVLAITADHGMPSEPPAGRRHFFDDIVRRIHDRFDTEAKLIQHFDDPANMQMYVDMDRLRTLGVSLEDIAAFLENEPYIAAAFTEDEVRAAGQTLRAY